MAWEVQHHTLCQGWINCWSMEVDGVSRPLRFATEAEAAFELQQFFDEISAEIDEGVRAIEGGYDGSEFAIIAVETNAID